MNKQANKTEMTLDGMMTFGMTEDKKHLLDFMSTEWAEVEPFTAHCKVQAMRDGNVYITELPKRVRGKAMFREDNSTLTLGRDGRYYFVFTLPKECVKELPEKLVMQALAIAQKVERMVGAKRERLATGRSMDAKRERLATERSKDAKRERLATGQRK